MKHCPNCGQRIYVCSCFAGGDWVPIVLVAVALLIVVYEVLS